MSPMASENGTEGDDEREEEDEEADTEEEEENNNEEEEEEEEEDEPRLKYQRMGATVPSLLSNDAASCVVVAERMIALGTRSGSVHILDFLGNQQDERELKRQKRKQSNRESARRSRLRKHVSHTLSSMWIPLCLIRIISYLSSYRLIIKESTERKMDM